MSRLRSRCIFGHVVIFKHFDFKTRSVTLDMWRQQISTNSGTMWPHSGALTVMVKRRRRKKPSSSFRSRYQQSESMRAPCRLEGGSNSSGCESEWRFSGIERCGQANLAKLSPQKESHPQVCGGHCTHPGSAPSSARPRPVHQD